MAHRKMTRRTWLTLMASTLSTTASAEVQWRDLPALPRPLGGHFVGITNDHLIVAGGSYFDTPPWDGGKKQFVDTVYVLRRGASAWLLAGHLPRPVASGAAASCSGGVACVGGQTPAGFTAQCHFLRMDGEKLRIDPLPQLPQSSALLSASASGNVVYAAGGQPSPTAAIALDSFRMLDVTRGKWQDLPHLPGTGRILPVLAAADNAIYLASGAAVTGDLGPPLGRRFLSDAYRFTGAYGWKRLVSLARPAQAAPAVFWKGRVFIFGGNDGSAADREFELREHHPGFSRTIYSIDPSTGKSTQAGIMPLSLVTSGVAMFGDEFVIPGGEARPAHRSARVIAGRLI